MMRFHFNWLQVLFCFAPVLFAAERPIRSYVASLDESSCTLAWGRLDVGDTNSIGHSSVGIGEVVVQLADQKRSTSQGWIRIENLKPDTIYEYTLSKAGAAFSTGRIRTWPAKASRLSFLVIGDWGNASKLQYSLAARMEAERLRLEVGDSPIRFVMSTGDNIYGGGSKDRDWDSRFFIPYASTLKSVPFYAVAGNHDGNESERSEDLAVYLDNFFSPSGPMRRWYRFQFGEFAEFFALDSTTNQHPGPKSPAYSPEGEQSRWLRQVLQESSLPWRIAFFHHPMFTAGPRHAPSLSFLGHWFEAMRDAGVSTVFSGHEHNLQFSTQGPETGGMQFVLSGAGGELRRGDVKPKMAKRNIRGWAAQAHFLVVVIDGDEMKITPISDQPMQLVDSSGKQVPLPIVVRRIQR